MRIGVIIRRLNHYRALAPLIHAALDRGMEVVCLHDCSGARDGFKGYLFPDPDKVPSFAPHAPRIVQYQDEDGLIGAITAAGVDVLVSNVVKHLVMPRRWREVKPLYAVVHYGLVDSMVIGKPWDSATIFGLPSDQASVDLHCLYSPDFVDFYRRVFAETGRRLGEDWESEFDRVLAPRLVATGFLGLDAIRRVDRNAVRARLGVSEGTPIVMMLPPVMTDWCPWTDVFMASSSAERWWRLIRAGAWSDWRWALHGWTYEAMARAVRRFCDANGALLIVKFRQKHPPPPPLVAAAHRLICDESEYPSTALELLAVADLSIYFFSTLVMESAFAGCFGLAVPNPSYRAKPHDSIFKEMLYNDERGNLYNFPGVNRWMTIPEVIRQLPEMRLADLRMDAEARRRFVAKFLLADDCRTAERVLAEIEKRLAQRADAVGSRAAP